MRVTYAEVEWNHAEDAHEQENVSLFLFGSKAWATRQSRCRRSPKSVAVNNARPQQLENDVDRLLKLVGHAGGLARSVERLADRGLVVVVVDKAEDISNLLFL
jgi:hypothetical protein